MKFIISVIFCFASHCLLAQDFYTILNIPKELLENSNSVILEEVQEVDVSNLKEYRVKVKRVIAIMNKKGRRHVDTYIGYDSDTRVVDIEAHVYGPLGNKLKKYKKKDFTDVSAVSDFSLYEDDRVKYIDYIPSSYPYIIQFEYETVSKSTAFIRSWHPLPQYNSATVKSEYRLKFDPNNKPKSSLNRLDGYDIEITETPNEIICKAKDVNAIKYEPYSPYFRKVVPHVKFGLDVFSFKGVVGKGQDWKEFGQWMNNALLQDIRELSPATITAVRGLVAGESSNIEKAKKIYQYVQDKVRYVSVQIGIGGWKPMEAKEVDRLGYGDCKALTNYTKALLDAVDVPSYYTVLYSDDVEMDIDSDFASIQGNHVILGVPNDDEIIWLECTSQVTPFGYGGNSIDDRDVLIITPEGGEIVHTKKYEFDENKQESAIDLQLDPEGNLKAQVKRTTSGIQYGQKFWVETMSTLDAKKRYLDNWGYINGLEIEQFQFQNDRENIVFTEEIQLNAPNYSSTVSENLLFCPNVFNRVATVPPRSSDRKLDFVISEGFLDEDVITVTLPEGYYVDQLPEPFHSETKYGFYETSYESIDETRIKYTRKFALHKGVFPPGEYSEYRKFIKTIAKKDKAKIVIKKTI